MTFGRPCMIPDKYVKLELPSGDMQVMGQTPESGRSPRVDAMYLRATM